MTSRKARNADAPRKNPARGKLKMEYLAVDDLVPYDGNPRETEHALLRVLRIIAGMRKSELLVFHGLLNGLTLTESSVACGFSKQNGSMRLKALVARCPELGAFVTSCRKAKTP